MTAPFSTLVEGRRSNRAHQDYNLSGRDDVAPSVQTPSLPQSLPEQQKCQKIVL